MSQYGDRGIDTGRSSATSPLRIEDLYDFLKGHWGFARKVHDGVLEKDAEMTGDAQFASADDALDYSETNLEVAADQDQTVKSAMRYDYHFAFPAPSMAEVRFSDGTFFHVLDMTKGLVRVEYNDGKDTYHGLFRIVSENAWLSVWRVMGPDTSQVITTHYLRRRVN